MKLEKFISIAWYMNHKPYSHHSGYDLFYLKMCRHLFEIISEPSLQDATNVKVAKEDCRDLAYILTAYFEDRVNNIGFWQSLVALHKKQFGKRLPFFDISDLKAQEDTFEDIFPADIHYLLFISYVIQMTDGDEKPVVLFDNPFFKELTKRVFAYMDETEEVPQTEFYESFLVPPDDYIDLKKRVHWFVFGNYLTGKEFTRKLEDHIYRQKSEEKGLQTDPVMLYAEEDRLMCEEPSSLTAFFPVDILAGAMRCSDEKKASVANLKWRPYGIFHVDNETAAHLRFVHTATREVFDVTQKSFNKPLNIEKHGDHWLTKLALWNGEAWISGACMALQLPQHEIADTNRAQQRIILKHFKPYQKTVNEMALAYRNKAAAFFGDELVVFDSGRDLQEKMNEFSRWYSQTIQDKAQADTDAKPPEFPLPDYLLSSRDVALFIPPADNITFILDHQKSLRALQGEDPELSAGEIREALSWMLDDTIDSNYIFYLRKKYALKNLSLLMPRLTATDKDLEALLRIYKPLDFSPLHLPGFSLSNFEEQLKRGFSDQ